MIPVFQEHADDCMPACLASILELPLGVVNNYAGRARDVSDQLRRHQRWLRRIGWTLVDIPLRQRRGRGKRGVLVPWGPMSVPCWCVVTAKVNGGRHLHALVGRVRGGRIDFVHDPSPQRWPNPIPVAVSFLVPAIRPGEKAKPAAPREGSTARPG